MHFIAISNGVDSERRESAEFAPFLNIMNEWYVRDTSRKITAVLRARGMSGRGVNIKLFDMEHPYMWRGGTVKTILTRMEYTGCTVNFRTKKESYKDKRPTKVGASEWIIFEDTQEPIIDKHTWETVQKLLDTPRRKGVFEENNPLMRTDFELNQFDKLEFDERI